ncbi:MAG: hypothetical protein KC492_36500 [Myxococcales bacterium]|nr:hypothetical protein [Myxococcales bacterium]
MGAQVLGKVTHATDGPRGPDVEHRIQIPRQWLEEGASIEFELPRNLSCAVCGGGGCDACERAGAISTRGRRELPELVQVKLPMHSDDGPPSSGPRSLVIRVPAHGGLAPEGSDLPRGNLLLKVRIAEEPEEGVTRVEDALAVVPPTPGPEKPAMALWVKLLAAAVVLYVIVLILLRISGRG